MKKWTAIMLVLVLLIFGSVIGFNLFKNHMMAQYFANMPIPTFPVAVQEVKASDWTPTIEAIGFIEPNQGLDISNETAGKVDKIAFESGHMVKTGDLLLSLDASVEQANLKASQGRMPATKANLDRMRSLYAKGTVSKGNLDSAEADYLQLAGQIESLQATINRMNIRAPFSGQVGIRNVYLGQYLQAGSDIVRLEDTSVMKIRFTIPQTDLSRVKVGQQLHIFVDAYPNQPFNGTISAIEPAVSAQSGVVQVQAAIPNSDSLLRSGMFAKVQVQLPLLPQQIAIPQTAINFTLYGQTVFVIEPGKDDKGEPLLDAEGKPVMVARQVVVRVGERKEDLAHILEGLKPGEQVVTSGQVRLSNGSHVKIMPDTLLTKPDTTPML
ncbi:MAG: efflux RND transporter periplasmic adaptor subunit [Aeromonadaceae bacterium]